MADILRGAADISCGVADILRSAADILRSAADILRSVTDICLPKTHFLKIFLSVLDFFQKFSKIGLVAEKQMITFFLNPSLIENFWKKVNFSP